MSIPQGFPSVSYPWVDKFGKLTQPAYQFLLALWGRTGGSGGGILVDLAGDATGPSTDNIVVSTHLAAPLPVNQGGTGGATQAAARAGLGLGTISVQDANAVTISGGSINATTVGVTTQAEGHFTTVETTSGAVYSGVNPILVATATSVQMNATSGNPRFMGDGANATIYAADGTTPLLQIADGGAGVNTPSGFYGFGTFTPSLLFGGSGVGITYTTQTGVYTRIGRMVTVSITIVLSATAGAGAATISGLPFTSLTGSTFSGSLSMSALAAGVTTSVQCVLPSASTAINLYRFAAGARTALAAGDFTATSIIDLTMTYQA